MRRMTYGGIDHSDAGWDKASLRLLAVLAVLVLLTFDQYGEGFDALVQDVYGQDVLRWYATLGHDRSALSYIDLYYYGGLFDGLAALANLVSPFGHWATRHLLEALFGLLGLVAVWRTARRLGGPLAGFLSLAALALMPSWYGMMFINPKDIPFAAMMAAALYAGTCILDAVPRPGWRRVVGFGACAGLALGVRVAGVLCFLYLALALLLAAWRLESARHARFRLALRFGLRILLPSFALAWTLMLICWPWAQTSPILHPWEALTHFAGIHSHIRTLFFGEEVGRQGVSALYLPVYLAIKLPEVVLVMLAAGLAALAGRLWRKVMPVPSPALLLVLLAAWFPLAYAMATAPQLYDAERHFLFVLPPLAILAGLGCARLLHETGGGPGLPSRWVACCWFRRPGRSSRWRGCIPTNTPISMRWSAARAGRADNSRPSIGASRWPRRQPACAIGSIATSRAMAGHGGSASAATSPNSATGRRAGCGRQRIGGRRTFSSPPRGAAATASWPGAPSSRWRATASPSPW